MRTRRKRHPITLLEVMIVILLIGVIGGVLSYNLKGALERGKKFRSTEGMQRLKEILELEIEKGYVTAAQLKGAADSKKVIKCVKNSGLISQNKIDEFVRDGWKEPFLITEKDGDIFVSSTRLDKYNQAHPKR